MILRSLSFVLASLFAVSTVENTSIATVATTVVSEMQPGGGGPPVPGVPACYKPNPSYYFPYLTSCPIGVPEFPCWADYQQELDILKLQYAACCALCIATYNSDPVRCQCMDECGAEFARQAAILEEDLFLCAISYGQ